MNGNALRSSLLKAANLWVKSSAKGGQYFTGRMGAMKVLILENRDRQNDDDPSHILYFAEAPPRQERADGQKAPSAALGWSEAIHASRQRLPGAFRRGGGLAGAAAAGWRGAAAGRQQLRGWAAVGAVNSREFAVITDVAYSGGETTGVFPCRLGSGSG
jgi:hypothetical protein